MIPKNTEQKTPTQFINVNYFYVCFVEKTKDYFRHSQLLFWQEFQPEQSRNNFSVRPSLGLKSSCQKIRRHQNSSRIPIGSRIEYYTKWLNWYQNYSSISIGKAADITYFVYNQSCSTRFFIMLDDVFFLHTKWLKKHIQIINEFIGSHIYILSYEKKYPRISTGSQKFRGRAATFPLPNRKMIANTSAKDVKIMKDAVRNTTYLTS